MCKARRIGPQMHFKQWQRLVDCFRLVKSEHWTQWISIGKFPETSVDLYERIFLRYHWPKKPWPPSCKQGCSKKQSTGPYWLVQSLFVKSSARQTAFPGPSAGSIPHSRSKPYAWNSDFREEASKKHTGKPESIEL